MDWLRDKNRRTAILITLAFHLVLVIILSFIILRPPFPPPPQLGVEVNLGNSNQGMGEVQPQKPKQQHTPVTPPPKAEKVEDVATQSTEKTISISKKKKKVEKQQPKEEKKEEPKINDKLLFKSKSGKTGGNEGQTSKPGDQGMENGDPNAKNYAGDGGSGGVTFSLAGRKKKYLPKPSRNFKEEGKVTVKIWVNRYGKVTNATVINKGTTTTNSYLRKLAVSAAMKAEFDSKPDAPEVQTGTITYVFVLE